MDSGIIGFIEPTNPHAFKCVIMQISIILISLNNYNMIAC